MRAPETGGWRKESELVDMKEGKEYAAVAIILCNESLVVEKRSSIRDDPWSGQFSLPGGHHSKMDNTLRDTAIRETLEETGVNLDKNAKYIGHLGPFVPRNRPNLEVYAYAFEIPEQLELISSEESEYLVWVELSELHLFEGDYGRSFKFREAVIWGLTERIIERFLELREFSTK